MRSGWVYVCVSGEVARVGDWGPASVSTTKTLPFPSVHSLRSSFSNTTWYAVCHVCCSVKRCILGINWFRSSCDTLCMPSQVPYGTTLLVALVQRYWCNVTGGATLLVTPSQVSYGATVLELLVSLQCFIRVLLENNR